MQDRWLHRDERILNEKLKPDDSPQPESIRQPQSDRITRWILIAIGIYTGLLVTLLNIFLLGSGKTD